MNFIIASLILMGIWAFGVSVYYGVMSGGKSRILRFSAIPPTPMFLRDEDVSFERLGLFRLATNSDRWYMLAAALFHLAKCIIFLIAAISLWRM